MYHRPGIFSLGWDAVVGVVVLWAVWSASGAPTAAVAASLRSESQSDPKPPELEVKLATEKPEREPDESDPSLPKLEPEPAPKLGPELEVKLATEKPEREPDDAAEGRRLQEAVDSCDVQTALERTVKVHAACCPDDEQCEGGWPHFCDSTCAPMFLDYYEKCHNVIRGELLGGSDEPDFPAAAEWDRLRDSCIEVSVPPVPPPAALPPFS